MPDDPLEEYEAEFADVVDPGEFQYRPGYAHNGAEVFDLLNKMTPLLCADLVNTLNEGRPPCCQYLSRAGVAITVSLVDLRALLVAVELPADMTPFVAPEEV